MKIDFSDFKFFQIWGFSLHHNSYNVRKSSKFENFEIWKSIFMKKKLFFGKTKNSGHVCFYDSTVLQFLGRYDQIYYMHSRGVIFLEVFILGLDSLCSKINDIL